MGKYYKREIQEDMYRRAVENRGYLIKDDELRVFTDAELIGYGAVPLRVEEIDGKFFVNYIIYDSCD